MSYENAKIVMLPIDSITPHPNNPRKELGDLAELAESIKTKGIMQNLTVVPNKGGDGYTVIIGHRRLSAARLAGLSEVPCAIVEMDEGDQLATMLLENMQRTDLTVYEQAEGFQLLLSNEFSVSDIAEKTGFSESTIRKRVKLLSLDKAKFKASEGRQVNLGDYERLYKIENEDKRNELLDSLGTNNFENEYRKALREQEDQAKVHYFHGSMDEFKKRKIRKAYGKAIENKNSYLEEFTYFRNYAVEYSAKKCAWIGRNGSDQHELKSLINYFHKGEVIGNIHDNPELLEEKE